MGVEGRERKAQPAKPVSRLVSASREPGIIAENCQPSKDEALRHSLSVELPDAGTAVNAAIAACGQVLNKLDSAALPRASYPQ